MVPFDDGLLGCRIASSANLSSSSLFGFCLGNLLGDGDVMAMLAGLISGVIVLLGGIGLN